MSAQMEPRENEIDLLLEIADAYDGQNLDGKTPANKENLRSKISQLITSTVFRGYNVDEKDIKIIAVILSKYLKNEDDDDEIRVRDVLKMLGRDTKAMFGELKRIERLSDLGILEVEKYHSMFGMMRTGKDTASGEDSIASIKLVRASISLSDKFLKIFKTGEKTGDADAGYCTRHETLGPYIDNLEYIADQIERLKILREADEYEHIPRFLSSRARSRRSRMQEDSQELEMELKGVEDRIAQKVAKTTIKLPFEELKKKKALTYQEELIIIALIEDAVNDYEGSGMHELVNLISKTTYERLNNLRLFKKEGRLVKEKIIEICPHRFLDEVNLVKLNEDVKAMLLDEKKTRKNKLKLKEDDFFEIVKPTVALDKVILHPKTLEDINNAMEMIRGRTSDILKAWGISGINLTESAAGKKKNQPLTMLLHGVPGTGKTLTANAIAYALKRSLLTFDCSKILSMWMGANEQNTRKIFDRYREIAGNMKNPPVLLLNEVDQFFHKRINAGHSVDHSYNQMQSIFLEQMEQFKGILIATTNIVDNLDSAFSRRFQYKIEFRRPGIEERLKLWRLYMPEKAPVAEDVSIQYLAEHYDLSGAQISLIVRNAATIAARRGDKICQADFIKACEDETSGNFDEKAKGRAGF